MPYDAYYAPRDAIDAARDNNIAEMKDLIAWNANLEKFNMQGDRAMHITIKKNNLEMLDLLIEAGANINVSNGSGDTPAHIAFKNGHSEALERLIKANAVLIYKDAKGQTVDQLMEADQAEKSISEGWNEKAAVAKSKETKLHIPVKRTRLGPPV